MAKKLKSLVEMYKEKEGESLKELGRKPGRPRTESKKVRLNFSLDEDLVADLKALASIKKQSLTAIFIESVEKEIEQHRRDIDILKAMQK